VSRRNPLGPTARIRIAVDAYTSGYRAHGEHLKMKLSFSTVSILCSAKNPEELHEIGVSLTHRHPRAPLPSLTGGTNRNHIRVVRAEHCLRFIEITGWVREVASLSREFREMFS
jgi:hypothetical protein